MKKIMILITGLGMGGAEKFVSQLVCGTKKLDITLVSILKEDEIGRKISEKGFKVYYLNKNNKFNFFKSIYLFKSLIKKHNPEILLTFLLHADLFGRICGRLFGIKKIICAIRNDNTNFKILNFFDKWSSFLVDLYIANSNSLIDFLTNKNSVNINKIKVITNGIDVDDFERKIIKNYDLRGELGIKEKDFIFTCVARLKKQKNHETIIQAFRYFLQRNPNSYLLIVGVGDMEDSLKNLSKELDIERHVMFLGNRHDVSTILYHSDVFVLASIVEGMSNAVLEAMSLGKCCIVSDIQQNMELIKDKVNGFIFKVRDEKDLYEKMLLSSDISLNKKYGNSARELIKQNYDISLIIRKYENLLFQF